jgi:inner membrane protein
MDTLTHALCGALGARLTAPRMPGADAPGLAPRLAVGFVAGMFPDIDFVLGYLSPTALLQWHRGITHSVLLLPLWAALLAWLAALAFRGRWRWSAFLPVTALALGLHIAADWANAFGTMLFAPLSDSRHALSLVFVIDAWFSGILVAGLLGTLLFRASRWPAVLGFVALAAYLGYAALMRAEALDLAARQAAELRWTDARLHAVPRPLSPHNWMVVVENDDGYRYALVNLRRSEVRPLAPDAGRLARIDAAYLPVALARWQRVERHGRDPLARALVREAWEGERFAFYRWFASLPALYRVDAGEQRICVWFQDLRFHVPGRANMPFRYGQCRTRTEDWHPYQYPGDGPRLRPRAALQPRSVATWSVRHS